MSTDTTHKMTFKGGDAKARLAAAAYVYILSKPWQEDWDETRRSIKVRVFRNESNCGSFLVPGDLCAEASALFPGVEIDHSSNNEYDESDGGWYCEEGESATNPLEKAADAILAKVLEVRKGTQRYQWLAQLASWVKEQGIRGTTLRRVNRAWQYVHKLKSREDAAATDQMKKSIVRALDGERVLTRRAVWSIGWYDLLPSTRFALAGKPFVEYYNRAESSLGKFLLPLRLRTKCGITFEDPMYPGATHRYVKGKVSGSHGAFGIHDGKVVRMSKCACVEECRGRSCIEYCSTNYGDGVIALQDLDNVKWLTRGKEVGGRCEVRYFEHSDDCRSNVQTPVLSHRNVYALFHDLRGTEATLVALRRSDGTIRWQQSVNTGSRVFWASRCRLGATHDGDAVVLSDGGGAGTLTRFRSSDGGRMWQVSVNTEESLTAMAIRHDSIVAVLAVLRDPPGSDVVFELACYSVRDGRRLWSVRDAGIGLTAKIISYGSHTIVCDSRRLAAFGPLGEVLWSTKVPWPARHSIRGLSVSEGGVVLVSVSDRAIYAFAAESGAQLWTLKAKVKSEVMLGLQGDGYFCAADAIIAVDTRTGSELWRSRRAEDDEYALAGVAPIIMNEGKIIVRLKKGLQVIDAGNGAEIEWIELPVDCWSASDMVADGGRVFVAGEPEGETKRLFCLALPEMRASGVWPMQGHDGRASFCLPSDSFTPNAARQVASGNAQPV